jgi:hypothetical protein
VYFRQRLYLTDGFQKAIIQHDVIEGEAIQEYPVVGIVD